MQLIGRNIFSLGLSRITSGVVLFFVYTSLAAYLGTTGFGKFALVLAYYTIFLLFVDLGISRYFIKKVSEDRESAPLYLGNFFIVQFFAAAGVFLLFLWLPRAFHYDPEVSRAMLYAGVGVFFGALSMPFGAIIQAWQKIHLLAAVYFFDSMLRAVWFILAMVWGKGLEFIFAVYILNGIIDVFLYWFLTRKLTKLEFSFDRNLAKSLLLFGAPFFLISGFEILVAKVDVVIQKIFLPYSAVGLYAAAYRFLDFLTFVPAVVAISLFPYFAEQKKLEGSASAEIASRLSRYMFSLALPVGIVITLLAKPLVLLLFGSEYVESIGVLRLLIWASVITFIYAVPNTIMLLKKTKQAIFILAAVLVLNVILNLVFVPRFGIMASAWITVLSYFLIGVVYSISAKRIMPFKLFGLVNKSDLVFLKSIFKS